MGRRRMRREERTDLKVPTRRLPYLARSEQVSSETLKGNMLKAVLKL